MVQGLTLTPLIQRIEVPEKLKSVKVAVRTAKDVSELKALILEIEKVQCLALLCTRRNPISEFQFWHNSNSHFGKQPCGSGFRAAKSRGKMPLTRNVDAGSAS